MRRTTGLCLPVVGVAVTIDEAQQQEQCNHDQGDAQSGDFLFSSRLFKHARRPDPSSITPIHGTSGWANRIMNGPSATTVWLYSAAYSDHCVFRDACCGPERVKRVMSKKSPTRDEARAAHELRGRQHHHYPTPIA